MTRVGVTGHQRLEEPEAWAWVASAMREQLSQVAPPLIAVSSLAIGADQLLAKLVLERGGQIYVVLPFADIERSFSPENLPAYRNLAKEAAVVEVLEKAGTDEDAYLAAGERVVQLSDIVLAVWDGKAAKGKGGTADIVSYALHRVPVIHIDPVTRTVRGIEPTTTC